jgi:hypothetical protein
MVIKNNFTILAGNYPWLDNIGDLSNFSNEGVKKAKKTTTGGKVRASAKNEPEVVYPIFKEISEKLEDRFWKNIFATAAIGKFHRGIMFRNNTLTYRNKNKPISVEINMEDVDLCAKEFIHFMNEKAGILSPTDNAQKKEELQRKMQKLASVKVNSWTQIKKQYHKTMLIYDFIKKYGRENGGLTLYEERNLEDIIRIGILCGKFNANNIIVVDGKIETINGLIHREDGTFDIDISSLKIKTKKTTGKKTDDDEMTSMSCTCTCAGSDDSGNEPVVKHKEVSLSKKWDKFLAAREKKIAKYSKK